MNTESLHKYLSIQHITPTLTEVMFSGQPCVNVNKIDDYYVWVPNPVFAKLTYGANVFADLPVSNGSFDTLEEAIADGLLKFEEMGSFATMVDLPDDTESLYESEQIVKALHGVHQDCIVEATKRASNVIEASAIAEQLFLEATSLKTPSSTSVEQIEERSLTDAEETKREEIVKALKKDKKFVSKHGSERMYAIATPKAKESA